MVAAAPAAPLLLGGPPGWVAYGVVVLGSAILAGAVVNEMTKNDQSSHSATASTTDTARKTCDRPYAVRVHAQGKIIGGTASSTLGAPPVVKPTTPVTVAEGLALSTQTFALLKRRQKKDLAPAKARLDRWMKRLPPHGFLSQHSEYAKGTPEPGGNRFDADSMGCTPNFVS
jgi:hypothetical protein